MQNEQKESCKEKALSHVKSVCPELMELRRNCKVLFRERVYLIQYIWASPCETQLDLFSSDRGAGFNKEKRIALKDVEIIGHTPHYTHFAKCLNKDNQHKLLDMWDLNSSSEEQSETVYKWFLGACGQ